MTRALRWAAMRAILMFHNCEGQSHKTVSTLKWKESRSRFEPRSLCLPASNALQLGQTGSLHLLPISRAFVTMPLRRWLSDVDRGWALAWLNDGAAVWEVDRRPVSSHSVIQTLTDRSANTGSVAEALIRLDVVCHRQGNTAGPRCSSLTRQHWGARLLFTDKSRRRLPWTRQGKVALHWYVSTSSAMDKATLRGQGAFHWQGNTERPGCSSLIRLDVVCHGQGNTVGPGCSSLVSRHRLPWIRQHWGARLLFTDTSRRRLP